MVFGALLEFALVNYITHFQVVLSKGKRARLEGQGPANVNRLSGLSNGPVMEILLRELQLETQGQAQQQTRVEEAEAKLVAEALVTAKKVDYAARILFPVIFIIFNLLYWGHYLEFYEHEGLME